MDSLEYIDSYFKGGFSPEEARQFERSIQDDPVFAEEVAWYLSASVALKEELIEEKKRRFMELYRQKGEKGQGEHARIGQSTIGGAKVRRLLPALAAAAVIIAIALSWLLFFKPVGASKLADKYIQENLSSFSVKMGAGDSLQTGLNLYNQGNFKEALQQFEGILQADSSNPTAMTDAGIVSLRLQFYDKALGYFKRLETRTDLQLNPALFYEALTIMKRDQTGDRSLAKQLLQEVVDNNLDKKNDALKLLTKM